MLTISIRDFQRNFYKHNKTQEDIVVTSKGKEVFKVLYCRDIKHNVVTKVVIPNVVTIKNKKDVVTKQDIPYKQYDPESDPITKVILEAKQKVKPLTEPRSINLAHPNEEKQEVDPILAAILEAKQKKAEVIQALKDKTEDILKEVIDKHYCLQCSKLGKTTEALKEYEVTTDTGERKAWLCGRCAGKALVYA